MGWKHIQDTTLGETSSGASVTTGTFGSANTLNNWVVVYSWGSNTTDEVAGQVTCSDNASTPNAYNQLGFVLTNLQSPSIWCAIFIGQILSLPSSGNLNATVTSGDLTNSIMLACASEYNGGGRGSSTVEASVKGTQSVGQPTTGILSTKSLDALVLSVCISQDASNPGTISVPPNFTSVASELNGATFKMGNGCYWITSGTNVNTTGGWTFDTQGVSGKPFAALQVSLALVPPLPFPVNNVNSESTGL